MMLRALRLSDLRLICPHTAESVLAERLPVVQAALNYADADTLQRAAAMLAQLAFESDWFNAWIEAPSRASGPHFEAYEMRRNLGNNRPGDGALFCGRGLIMLTGRDNYTRAGRAVGVDLVGHPELAADPDVAAKIAAWYWVTKGCNALADAGDYAGITQVINGGQNGAVYRAAAWQRAHQALSQP